MPFAGVTDKKFHSVKLFPTAEPTNQSSVTPGIRSFSPFFRRFCCSIGVVFLFSRSVRGEMGCKRKTPEPHCLSATPQVTIGSKRSETNKFSHRPSDLCPSSKRRACSAPWTPGKSVRSHEENIRSTTSFERRPPFPSSGGCFLNKRRAAAAVKKPSRADSFENTKLRER